VTDSNQIAAGSLRILADRGACCAYGVCALICPEIYTLNEAGIIALENDSVVVPPELADKAREGAEACPQHVFTIELIDVSSEAGSEAAAESQAQS
jgi:ferredoxin